MVSMKYKGGGREEIKSEIENTRLKTCRLDINFTNESKRDTCPTSGINECNIMPIAKVLLNSADWARRVKYLPTHMAV